MTTFGTAHFRTRQHAMRYYQQEGLGFAVSDVNRKILDGEIHIGPPPRLYPTDKITVDSDGRYHILITGDDS